MEMATRPGSKQECRQTPGGALLRRVGAAEGAESQRMGNNPIEVLRGVSPVGPPPYGKGLDSIRMSGVEHRWPDLSLTANAEIWSSSLPPSTGTLGWIA